MVKKIRNKVIDNEIFNFDVIFKTFSFIWQCSKKHTIIRLILVILQATLPLIPIFLFKLILDLFVGQKNISLENFFPILIAFGLVQFALIIVRNLSTYNTLIQNDIYADFMSEKMINKSLEIDLEYFDSDNYHDQFHRALGQGGVKSLGILTQLTAFTQNILSLLVIVLLLFTLHWSITLILVVIAFPVALIKFIYSEKIVKLYEKQTPIARKAGYFKGILTKKDYAQEVRVFQYGENLLNTFLALAKKLRLEKRNLFSAQLKSVSIAQTIEAVAVVLALTFILYKATSGGLSVGDISLYFLTFQKGQSNVNAVMSSAVQIHQQKLMLNYLFNFLSVTKRIKNPIAPTQFPKEINSLSIENLSFTYPETDKQILENINLEIKKGEMIAIVGENGSGKTTLIKLINRLYDPNEGSIKFNNEPITNFQLSSLRKSITVLFQKFSSYNFSVDKNIRMSALYQDKDTNQEIKNASKHAQADEFINQLPKKYDTQLGRIFHGGHELSGGQWQKIALSRAFYKDADIVILDEPTSQIDPIAEDAIFSEFRNIVSNKILILITHRIYNLKMADKIVVLDKGKIVEQGSHIELMVKNGLYKEMFEKQDVS